MGIKKRGLIHRIMQLTIICGMVYLMTALLSGIDFISVSFGKIIWFGIGVVLFVGIAFLSVIYSLYRYTKSIEEETEGKIEDIIKESDENASNN